MNRTEDETWLPPLLPQVKVWQLESTGNNNKKIVEEFGKREGVWKTVLLTRQNALYELSYFTRIHLKCLMLFFKFRSLGHSYMTFINDLCSSMKHSKYFSFFHIKIVSTVNSATDCTLLQSDIDSIRGWCVANNIIRSAEQFFIAFTGKIN
jgi:hypothetical protein